MVTSCHSFWKKGAHGWPLVPPHVPGAGPEDFQASLQIHILRVTLYVHKWVEELSPVTQKTGELSPPYRNHTVLGTMSGVSEKILKLQ